MFSLLAYRHLHTPFQCTDTKIGLHTSLCDSLRHAMPPSSDRSIRLHSTSTPMPPSLPPSPKRSLKQHTHARTPNSPFPRSLPHLHLPSHPNPVPQPSFPLSIRRKSHHRPTHSPDELPLLILIIIILLRRCRRRRRLRRPVFVMSSRRRGRKIRRRTWRQCSGPGLVRLHRHGGRGGDVADRERGGDGGGEGGGC